MGEMREISKEVIQKLLELEENLSDKTQRNKSLEDAARLADLYSNIHPEPYILPLDALAGITEATTKLK